MTFDKKKYVKCIIKKDLLLNNIILKKYNYRITNLFVVQYSVPIITY